tara:strand:+ start:367 stop:630 length:264 start_codon:yes stop_codon:yes gene_type:complete
MNYKELMGFGEKKKKIIKEQIIKVNKYLISEKITSSNFYNELTPMEQHDISKYFGKEVKLFNENIGFDKTDSLVNGIKIPKEYLIKK